MLSLLAAATPRRASVPVACAIEETWLNPILQQRSFGEHIQDGDLVLCMPNAATTEEVQTLLAAGVAQSQSAERADYIQAQTHGLTTGRARMYVPVELPQTVPLCEEILLRVLDRVNAEVPSIYEQLFRACDDWATRQPLNAQGEQPTENPPEYLAETFPSLRELYEAGELEYSEGEPAVNVYTEQGYFGAHKDHLALTVLIPLTEPGTDFSGGGTGFWPNGRAVDENPQSPPVKVVKPAAGTALLFGGDVTHGGMAVEGGLRSVFVASFSTRTEASKEDRVQGLRLASAVAEVPEPLATPPPPPMPSTEVAAAESDEAAAEDDEVASAETDERLVQLRELLDLELLTQAEHDEKRAQILDSP